MTNADSSFVTVAWRLSSGDEAAGLAGPGMAGDAGDLVYVHGRLGQARGVQAVPERGRERGMVQCAVGDDCGVDAVIGLADLVFDDAWRRDHGIASGGREWTLAGDRFQVSYAALDVHPGIRLRDEGATCSSSQACQCTPVI